MVAGTQDQILRPLALVGGDVVFFPYTFVSVVKVILDAGFLALLKRPVAGEDEAVLFGVAVPEGNQFLELFWILLGKVVGLAGVVLEVEQLPVAAATCGAQDIEDLPVALPDGAVAEQFPANPVAFAAHGIGRSIKERDERLAL